MGTVTVFTADRMLAIENGSIVDGDVVGDNLILQKKDGTPVDAGNVRGPQGIAGATGATGPAGADAAFKVRVATTANITLSGSQTIDGIVVSTGDLVLVKDQTTASQNGIYTVASGGAWARPASADSAAELAGLIVLVQRGTAHGGTRWATSFKGTDTVDTTAMPWQRVLDGFSAAYVTKAGGSTDASGFITVTHNLGWAPRMVFGMQSNPDTRFAVLWGVDTITTTTFRCRFMNASSAGGLNALDIGSYVFLCIR